MYSKLVGPSRHFIPVGTGVLGVETLSAAAAVHGEFAAYKRCLIKRVLFYVTTAVAADATAPVVAFKKRTAAGVSASESVIATLTIPDEAAVGEVYYKDLTENVYLEPGQALALEQTVQAADGSAAAGAGYYAFEVEDSPEYAGNEVKMIKSI